MSLLGVPGLANGCVKDVPDACTAHDLTPFSPDTGDQTTDGQASQGPGVQRRVVTMTWLVQELGSLTWKLGDHIQDK